MFFVYTFTYTWFNELRDCSQIIFKWNGYASKTNVEQIKPLKSFEMTDDKEWHHKKNIGFWLAPSSTLFSCIELFWADRYTHQYRKAPPWHRADKFSKFVPLDTLKKHSLAHSVLRILCKRFSKLLKLTLQKTLFRGWFIKIHIFKEKVCMAMSLWLWELQNNLSVKMQQVVQKESQEAV